MPSKGSVPNSCQHCGKHYLARPTEFKYGKARFCSVRCRGLASRKDPIERFWAKVDKRDADQCWLWTAGADRHGYGRFHRVDGVTVLAHRYAYELVHGLISSELLLLHSCDTPACVNVLHLRPGTYADNSADMVKRGRSMAGDRSAARRHPERLARGERHGSRTRPERLARGERQTTSKLTDNAVREMRSLYTAGGWTQKQLAEKYGVDGSTISEAVRGVTWSHVT